jgi:tRNA (guanosine-2'-O-)-methyltransferase
MDQASIERLIDEHGAATVIEAARPLLSEARIARIDAVLEARLDSLTAVLEDLYDPHNGAAAIRSIEAFGLTTIHAVEAANPFPVTEAVTIGANRWIDVCRHPDPETCASALRERGFRLAATTPEGGGDPADLDMSQRWAVWFGNEREGLSARAISLADVRLALPMHGFTRSFNLSVSVALTIRELAAARRATLGAPGDLAPERRERLRARFMATGVRGIAEIIARHIG